MAKTVSSNTKIFLNLKTSLKFLFNTKSFQTVVKPLPWFIRFPSVCFQTKWNFLWVRHVDRSWREEAGFIIQNCASRHPTARCMLEFCCLTSCLLLLILDSISILLGICLYVEVCFSGWENWRLTWKLDSLIHFFPPSSSFHYGGICALKPHMCADNMSWKTMLP